MDDRSPWTNVYGVARTLLALGTLLTLTSNPTRVLFAPAAGLEPPPFCHGAGAISLFCIVGEGRLELARWIAVALLVVVASGWRPRVTALAHWWVAFSLQVSAMTLDGGDQITAVLTLLLLPIAMTDRRRWHWSDAPLVLGASDERRGLIAWSAATMIRLQVAGLYLHSFAGKFVVAEWTNGTAIYYWWTDATFGAAAWLRPILVPLLRSSVGVVTLTWTPLLLELLLFLGIVSPPSYRRRLLPIGIAFHGAIAVVQGLVSFSFAMTAALILYLRALNVPFSAVRQALSSSAAPAAHNSTLKSAVDGI